MTEHQQILVKASSYDLEGRVAVITGAGQGLGREFAKAFSRSGAISVIAEINARKGSAVLQEIQDAGGIGMAIETDVGELRSVESMVAKVVEAYGRLDILVNNAGIFTTLKMRPFDQIPLEEWDRVLHVNTTGAFYCCRAVVPHMRRAKWGRIVNVSSGAITLGRPNYLHYITSKSALVGMSRSLARELGSSNITVNALLPGATYTEIERETVTPAQKEAIVSMQCIPRAEAPSDLVGVVLFLATQGAGFLTGQSINVDGGATHL